VGKTGGVIEAVFKKWINRGIADMLVILWFGIVENDKFGVIGEPAGFDGAAKIGQMVDEDNISAVVDLKLIPVSDEIDFVKVASAVAEITDPTIRIIIGDKLALASITGVVKIGGAIETDPQFDYRAGGEVDDFGQNW